jgi:hypothetical protein
MSGSFERRVDLPTTLAGVGLEALAQRWCRASSSTAAANLCREGAVKALVIGAVHPLSSQPISSSRCGAVATQVLYAIGISRVVQPHSRVLCRSRLKAGERWHHRAITPQR